ncbi:hypothetical protein AOQ84DRAFT_375923 [Glonium stellatum]|uniref:Clr5 domain-containing protein n=1 Tax=Glonium stellatum TaxID=574774 RepID=A0A8E2F3A9_9PEZI|nr:hypothetical protein AOQ84DRAFT_375923 [Glonium stellatum]
MPAPQQFRWKDQATPRAKPLPSEKWEEHKEELRDLYQKKTLDNLINVMKDKHGFMASRRQYVSQFEKWGIRKNNIVNRPPAWHATPAQHALGARANPPADANGNTLTLVGGVMGEIRLAGNPFRDPIVPASTPKRPNSMQSIPSLQSLQHLQSLDGRPKVPPKKRQKLAEYVSSKNDPYAKLGLAFDTQESPSDPKNETTTPPGRTSLRAVGNEPDLDFCTPRLRAADAHSPDSDDTSDMFMMISAMSSMKNLELNDENGKDKLEPFAGPSRAPPADKTVNLEQVQNFGQESQQKRRFDSTRLIDTFDEEDIHHMKLAADFLHTVGFDGDAFTLYVLLLQRSKQSLYPSPQVMMSAMIMCARSAYWPAQVEIARNNLEPKFEPRGASTSLEHFLFRMILADTHTRLRDQDMADLIIEHTMGCEFADEKLLLQVPPENRSLDLLTYQYLTHGLSYKDKLVRDAISCGHIPYDYPVFEKSQLALCFLQQAPGPFMLQSGTMKNPCIRACLQWCVAMLESTAKMTESWQSVQPNGQNSPSTNHFRLFCCLWECCRGHQTSKDSSGALVWESQAEKLMGISAAELLGTLCWMIIRASPKSEDLGSESDLILLQAHAGAASLIMRSDEELGGYFLNEFTYLDISTRMSPEQKAFRTTTRECARKFIEKSLSITLPEAQGSYAEANDLAELSCIPRLSMSASWRSLGIVAAALGTLGPSPESIELSSTEQSFRRLHLRIREDFPRATHNAAMTLPSSLYARNSSINLLSMSNVSQAMTSSLSLQSLRTTSTSVLERASTISSKVRESVAEFEGGPLSNTRLTMRRIVNVQS